MHILFRHQDKQSPAPGEPDRAVLRAAAPEAPGCGRGQQDLQCQWGCKHIFPKARALFVSFYLQGTSRMATPITITILIAQGLICCRVPIEKKQPWVHFPHEMLQSVVAMRALP